MKLVLTIATALIAGTAAIAQTTGGAAGGADTMAPSTSTTMPADATMPSTTGSSSTDTMGASSATTGASAGMMTQENGKWMVDGRAATKSEIAAHKKSMKKPN